jgi:periplasmic divalent cation tolerance protein
MQAEHYKLVLTTCADQESAESLARPLVEEGLVACINIIPQMSSLYRWQGEVKCERETLLLIKTTAEQYSALERRLLSLHEYELPEIIGLDITAGLPDYLGWLTSSVEEME